MLTRSRRAKIVDVTDVYFHLKCPNKIFKYERFLLLFSTDLWLNKNTVQV